MSDMGDLADRLVMLSKTLGGNRKPYFVSEDRLQDSYCGLHLLAKKIKNDFDSKSVRRAKKLFDLTEFEATYSVLRMNKIQNRRAENRKFLETIYSEPWEYKFFNEREHALFALADIDAVKLDEYKI